nr:hypothetical protein [Elusimicrobiota bacterium]
GLTEQIQKLADKNFQLLKRNSKHPSLHFKKIDKLWSVRIGIVYRALAIKEGESFIWIWIGSHNDYEKTIK